MTRAIESTEAARLCLRRARFEDVNTLLRLIAAAVEQGCRDHYGPAQRQAVFLTYAESLFVDVIQPFDTIIAERDDQAVGMAQLDPAAGRLRALFVTPALQGRGLGRVLVSTVERLARAHRLRIIDGAMSLNAVPFYRRMGFEARPGPDHLIRGGVMVPIVNMHKSLGPEAIEDSRR
jgi:N-acetylglutamate synthase-like GNAT family acetyltransferase